jgi:hypothetical protein
MFILGIDTADIAFRISWFLAHLRNQALIGTWGEFQRKRTPLFSDIHDARSITSL